MADKWAKVFMGDIHSYEWRRRPGDVLRPLYEQFVDERDRKAFGEFYTPDWLAEMLVAQVCDDEWCEAAIAKAIPAVRNAVELEGVGVLDPTCGSGTFHSGLCAASATVKRAFATDVLNLTLASPGVNRHQKSAKDVAQWTPPLNACWFAARTLEVRRKYGLTIDRAEAVEAVLSRCDSTEMVVVECGTPSSANRVDATVEAGEGVDALALWDDNRNGRITCAEARRHGIAPVHRGHPAYRFIRDGDGDGVVCE